MRGGVPSTAPSPVAHGVASAFQSGVNLTVTTPFSLSVGETEAQRGGGLPSTVRRRDGQAVCRRAGSAGHQPGGLLDPASPEALGSCALGCGVLTASRAWAAAPAPRGPGQHLVPTPAGPGARGRTPGEATRREEASLWPLPQMPTTPMTPSGGVGHLCGRSCFLRPGGTSRRKSHFHWL